MTNPHSLPVYEHKDVILEALAAHQVIVIESPTGSGKTTQIPVILNEAGYAATGIIGVTQPRRIAAVSVSAFIQRQLAATDSPGLVGYKMRFDDKTTPATKIKIMTDGILLQEMKLDYLLSDYSVIMVDEAHERSLNIDFVLGLLKRVLERRPNFKVVISSATINAQVFSDYFNGCPIVRIETQVFPVQVIYDAPARDPADDAAAPATAAGERGRRERNDARRATHAVEEALVHKAVGVIARIMHEKRPGDILVFMPGEKTIKDTNSALADAPFRKRLVLVPLYSRLSKEEQDAVFIPTPAGKTKIVVATNIAETSITIDGITTVIDSGLAKLNFYNPRTFTASLEETAISKASANQRKGRAGRTQPGTCYRLYRKDDFDRRQLYTVEEIYRTDLSEVVLRMAELGITDFDSFDFISSPGKAGIAGAVETLLLLDALDEVSNLSTIGKAMALFPLLPRHSRMIVEAIRSYPDVVHEVLIAASFLTTNSPFLLPQGEEAAARQAHHHFRDPAGDFVSYLKLFAAYNAALHKDQFCERYYLDEETMAELVNIHDQLSRIVSDMGVPIGHGGSTRDYLCAIAKGHIQFVCVRGDKTGYRSLTAERVEIHPGSVLFRETPQFIVAGEIVKTTRMFARSVSPLEREWLATISPKLAGALVAGTGRRTRGAAGSSDRDKVVTAARDTTWQIVLGGKIFSLHPYKGKKKIAVLPWAELQTLVSGSKAAPGVVENLHQYANLRGVILFGQSELMRGERLPHIVKASRYIDLPKSLIAGKFKKKTFDVFAGRHELILNLDSVLKVVHAKKSQGSLGFLALYSDRNGRYWLKPTSSFAAAVSESIAAMESLIDDLAATGDGAHPGPATADRVDTPQAASPAVAAKTAIPSAVNDLYRRLIAILENV